MQARCGGGILAQEVVVLPVAGGTDRTRHKAATAVRADVGKQALDTTAAKGALERADPCLDGVRGEHRCAVLANGSELKHRLCQSIVLVYYNDRSRR